MNVFPHFDCTCRQDPEVIDRAALEAAQLVVEGRLDEDCARQFIGGLLLYSKMPMQVVRETMAKRWPSAASEWQVRDDLTDRCVELLQRKVADRTFFDLSMIAGGRSFSGWCRQLLRSQFGAHSELRNLSTDYNKHIPASQRLGLEDEQTILTGPAESPEESFQGQGYSAALMSYADQMFGAREQERHHVAAATLCQVYELPRVRTLPTAAARQAVSEALDADPKVAYRAASQLRAGLISEQDSPQAQVFSGFSSDDLETVVEKDWKFAAVLAQAAVAATPPVVQTVAVELTRRFQALVQPGSPASHMAKMTARAWLTAMSTMVGDEYSKQGWHCKPDQQMAEETAEFTRQATRLLAKAQLPDLSTVSDVDRWLERLCERLQQEHAQAVADERELRKLPAA